MNTPPQTHARLNGKPLVAATGTFRWVMRPGPNRPGCLLINGAPYLLLELLDGLVRVGVQLVKEDGTVYDLDTTVQPWTCDCPDYLSRRQGTSLPCKHVAAVAKALQTLATGKPPAEGGGP